MTLTPTEQEVLKALLIAILGGQDELPRKVGLREFTEQAMLDIAKVRENARPEPVRLSAANSSEISKAYITGTKDGLAVASRLVERTFGERLGNLDAFWRESADNTWKLYYSYCQQEARLLRGKITEALAEETKNTEAQEGN